MPSPDIKSAESTEIGITEKEDRIYATQFAFTLIAIPFFTVIVNVFRFIFSNPFAMTIAIIAAMIIF